MVRIAGVNLPQDKKIKVALTYLYGVGPSNVYKILKKAGVNPEILTKELSEEDFEKIKSVIEKDFKVEGALRAQVIANIKRLKDIGSYRGLRHMKNLPVRGQKTRSNARTKRGKKVTMATARKVASEKT